MMMIIIIRIIIIYKINYRAHTDLIWYTVFRRADISVELKKNKNTYH